MQKPREPGLASIQSARQGRARGRYSRLTPSTWLVAFGAIIVTLGGYWIFSERALGRAKARLLAKRRAVVQTIGPAWFSLAERVERATLAAAHGNYAGDMVQPEARAWFTSVAQGAPGIYLRLRATDATSVDTLREAAAGSVKDGFVACLLHEPRGAKDFPEQPWNLRQAYRATRILTEPWAREVNESGDDLRLRVFEEQFERANKTEIPLAVDIVQRAEFYLLVVDEDAAGAPSEEALQLVEHPARVHLIDLRSGRELFRLRRAASASVEFAGERAVRGGQTRDAIQRQVNNCALAEEVLKSVTGV